MEGLREESARSLAKALIQALNELGPSVASVILHYFEARAGVGRKEVHKRPEVLAEVMREILGPLSPSVEEYVARRVAAKLNIRAPLSFPQILSLISSGIGPAPCVTVEARLRGDPGGAAARLAELLERLGARLLELKLSESSASLRAEWPDERRREVEALLERRDGEVAVLLRLELPGAVLSAEEYWRLKSEAERIVAELGP